ncbi:KTSC domain-containing protein [Spirulina sp. CS-785/01]|uniref:KTSC domain-containing protein n=1 Tax=Spirulina sp. CS-785/01 TaxID=3021716 RepID=UPI002330D8FE|nr:KTSC domain-containing protein [Spirulina sp. CS-785/01]MDB9313208.1 KTSC domain-containing protein [Spirulina sp. CS-785/01]
MEFKGMELNAIDLKKLIAIGHDEKKLALLIERGTEEMEYLEVNAPKAAYDGLKAVSALVNEEIPAIPEPSSLTPSTVEALYPANSSCTNALAYDPQEKLLEIEFTNGSVYQYEGVEPETWNRFRQAKSPGRFYNRAIKGSYEGRRVE